MSGRSTSGAPSKHTSTQPASAICTNSFNAAPTLPRIVDESEDGRDHSAHDQRAQQSRIDRVVNDRPITAAMQTIEKTMPPPRGTGRWCRLRKLRDATIPRRMANDR